MRKIPITIRHGALRPAPPRTRLVLGTKAHDQIAESQELRPADAAIYTPPLGRDLSRRPAALGDPSVTDHRDVREPRECPGEMTVQECLSGANDEQNPYPGKRSGGQLLEELRGVSAADAVSVGLVVEWLAFAEDGVQSLFLTPGADDSHRRHEANGERRTSLTARSLDTGSSGSGIGSTHTD